ncbi:MAG: IrrE N-terminal-like domain [Candidatus Atribacteria bacterium]|nr:IrrE N-terminal-like domain [Candidatus Atribacteria bacterium]
MGIPAQPLSDSGIQLLAQKVIKDSGFSKPPICEKRVAQILGIMIKEFVVPTKKRKPPLLRYLSQSCSYLRLQKGKPCIFVWKEMSRGRVRLSVFHECAHFIIPWHKQFNYLAPQQIPPFFLSRLEDEAFRLAEELIAPREMVWKDLQSKDPDFATIEWLRHRYQMSRAVALHRFVRFFPGAVASFVLVPLPTNNSLITQEIKTSPFFPYFIRPKMLIKPAHPLYQLYYRQSIVPEEVEGRTLGVSGPSQSYLVQIFPHFPGQKAQVLLWSQPSRIKPQTLLPVV